MDLYSELRKKLNKKGRICPKCHKKSVVIEEDRVYCKNCGFEMDLN